MTDPLVQLQQILDEYLGGADSVHLLEAGCGSTSKVRLGANVSVTGIDISPLQLERNEALNEKILGDLQTYQFPKNCFDIIICWDVLEHLDKPDKALDQFFSSVKPGGLIILAYPNLYSLKGIITKLTPHVFHVWYYHYLLHRPDAGKNDTAPFVTFLRLRATYPVIRKMARANHAHEIFLALRESLSMRYVRQNFPFFDLSMNVISAVSRTLSLGNIDLSRSDCIQVFKSTPLQK